jgi:hypothetical protein
MKVGDLVTTKSRNFIGVVIESRTMVAALGLSTEHARLRGKNLNSHHVYWGDTKVKKNPVWVKERDLVKPV